MCRRWPSRSSCKQGQGRSRVLCCTSRCAPARPAAWCLPTAVYWQAHHLSHTHLLLCRAWENIEHQCRTKTFQGYVDGCKQLKGAERAACGPGAAARG